MARAASPAAVSKPANSVAGEDNEEEEMDWIGEFRSEKGHEWYCDIPLEYLKDKFNLSGIAEQVTNYSKCLDILTGENDYDDIVEEEIENLYFLIHSRYILSDKGLRDMKAKYLEGVFGLCPRSQCENQRLLPIGLSPKLNMSRTYSYCPRCQDIYFPNNEVVLKEDGAAFGPSFAALFVAANPDIRNILSYEPTKLALFGFKIHGSPRLVRTFGDQLPSRRSKMET